MRVGLIDIDPQAHASLHLGLDPAAKTPTVYDLLTDDARLADLWQRPVVPTRKKICGSPPRTSIWPPPKWSWPAWSAAK